MQIKLIN